MDKAKDHLGPPSSVKMSEIWTKIGNPDSIIPREVDLSDILSQYTEDIETFL